MGAKAPKDLPRRTRKLPARLRDFVVHNVAVATADVVIPTTYNQAKKSPYWPQWEAAMKSELDSFEQARDVDGRSSSGR